ncbi:MAG: SDR family NAD(P)-dependent oxidoreductase [bacterium]|nr:SDR family NAD(P)-dependent oxidoreductase [bacterium]
MRYVITGGSGFIGSKIAARLLKEGNEVVVFDNLSSGQSKNLEPFKDDKNLKFVQGDVTDKSALEQVLEKGVNTVFHLSAVVGIKNYMNPLRVVDVNVIGTRNVLELALKNNIKVLLTSTSEVFGKNPKSPWKEDDDRVLGSTKVDRWSYSTSKAMCEHMVFSMCRHSGLSAVIVRFFNIYGPGQPPYFVVSQSVQKVLKNESPLLYDSGDQTRCFTYVDDAIEGTLRAARSDKAVGDVFNIGNNKESTMKEVVELIIEVAGKKGILDWKKLDTSAHYGNIYEDIPKRVPDVSKAKAILDWEATTSLRDGLQKTVDWSRENQWWLDLEN